MRMILFLLGRRVWIIFDLWRQFYVDLNSFRVLKWTFLRVTFLGSMFTTTFWRVRHLSSIARFVLSILLILAYWWVLIQGVRILGCRCWRLLRIVFFLGRRVVLLNSVLTSIPIFYFSFMKIPSIIRKAIIRLQRNILWGTSAAGGKKIPWWVQRQIQKFE
jgi:hypothetical protein